MLGIWLNIMKDMKLFKLTSKWRKSAGNAGAFDNDKKCYDVVP